MKTKTQKTSNDKYEATLQKCLLRCMPLLLPVFLEGTQLLAPTEFVKWERKLRECILEVEGNIAQEAFTALFNNPGVEYRAKQALARQMPGLRDAGRREFKFTCLSGRKITVRTPYFDTRDMPKEEKAKRKKEGTLKCSYPIPEMLGITDKLTPTLAWDIAKAVIEGPSMKWAKRRLAWQGIRFSTGKVRKVARIVASNAIEWRKSFLSDKGTKPSLEPPENLKNKVVKIDVDGGRIRTRVPNRGRRRKNGYRGYKRDWTEPLIFTITVLDSKGKKDRSYKPVYDGTICGVDAMFSILESYLSWMHIADAKKIQFTADGDKKLWPRFQRLVKRLDLPEEKVFMILDYPHAVQHLWQIMDLKPSWSRARKEEWVQTMKDLLFQDEIDTVIDLIGMVARGRNASKIRRKAKYFQRRRDQMLYGTMKREGLGIGSGTVESAIRRIVNLRLKAPGSFWKPKSLDGYLMIRSYLMAGRWNEVMDWSIANSGLC